jgi:hypothetical protein
VPRGRAGRALRHDITFAREKRATAEDTPVGNIDWNQPRSWEEVCRRHAARRRWNAVRRVVAEDRRRQVLELVLALGGLQRGTQSRIAAALGVHRSTICKDLRRLLPLATPCPTCGALRPRDWWEEV